MPQSAVSRLRASKADSSALRSGTTSESEAPATNGQTLKRSAEELAPSTLPGTKRQKMLAGQFSLKYDFPSTPWRDEPELALLRDSFFPHKVVMDPYSTPPPDSRHEAVEQVRRYETSHSRIVPHAMSATALLSEAMAFEESFKGQVSEGVTRSVYSMAFTRFVTGFVDRDVKMGKLGVLDAKGPGADDNSDDDGTGSNSELEGSEREADGLPGRVATRYKAESSMYAYAAHIGMPEHFVDLRHQTVHGQLSDTPYLRQRTQEALEWLWENWWKKHVKGDSAREKRRRWLHDLENQTLNPGTP